ncbi:MAG TPA: serine hydrolase domain-containing protein, partial [Acidimicrobiales bacterium]|nr:serine hydrolase domain-containing protein [Acidimicrobiales bacterium]
VAAGFEGVRGAFQANFDAGKEVGAAFAAYHRGQLVVDLWGGIADQHTEKPWEEDTLVLVYSTTKGATALCANKLIQEGALDADAAVVTYWPEFAQAGKEAVTVTDLLAHRAGLAWIDGSMSFDEMVAWEPVVRALGAQAPSWPPGTAHGYHATTFGWLVGEVVRRVSGKSVGRYLADEIAGPLAADFYIGLPARLEDRVARLVSFAEAGGAGAPLEGLPGAGGDQLGQLAEYLAPDGALTKALNAPGGALSDPGVWNTPELHRAEVPAANGICDARSLARLYGAAVSDVVAPSGEKVRILSPEQLTRAVHQETEGPDKVLLGLDMQWGLGFMINRGLIDLARIGGPRSFGHFGMGGSAGWAEPDAELAMGYVMNKMVVGTTGDTRSYRLMHACLEAAAAR